jgi:hypothetical protein
VGGSARSHTHTHLPAELVFEQQRRQQQQQQIHNTKSGVSYPAAAAGRARPINWRGRCVTQPAAHAVSARELTGGAAAALVVVGPRGSARRASRRGSREQKAARLVAQSLIWITCRAGQAARLVCRPAV